MFLSYVVPWRSNSSEWLVFLFLIAGEREARDVSLHPEGLSSLSLSPPPSLPPPLTLGLPHCLLWLSAL